MYSPEENGRENVLIAYFELPLYDWINKEGWKNIGMKGRESP